MGRKNIKTKEEEKCRSGFVVRGSTKYFYSSKMVFGTS
jgi:hypothetical protein